MIRLVGLATEPDDTDAEEASDKLPHPLMAGAPLPTRTDGSTIYNPNWHRDINDRVNKAYITAVVKLCLDNNKELAVRFSVIVTISC